MAIGVHKARGREKADPEFDAFLRKQSRLIDLQTEHLHEQRELMTSRLRLGRWKDRVTLALQAMTALVGLVVAAAVAVMAWQAHEDHGVSIEAFSVPPDLAQRGLTGQVVASELLDGLAELQAKTVTARPASTYANDWGGDIKVEIPETGVSIGELNRYLRQWLGSETKITGEVVRTPAGLAVTARAGAQSGKTFQGADADLDKLVQQAAEAVYASTQPYRYAVYLASVGRNDEALAAYQRLAQSGAREDRPWAYTGWATLLMQRGDPRAALAKASRAIELDPRIEPAYVVLNNAEGALGRDERALAGFRAQLRMLQSGQAEGVTPEAVPVLIDELRGELIPTSVGDYAQAVSTDLRLPTTVDVEGFGGALSFRPSLVGHLANLHDVSAARRAAIDPPQSGFWLDEQISIAAEQEDWPAVLALMDQAPRSASAAPNAQGPRAFVLARLGRLAEAEAAIAQTPPDCTNCLEVRGYIRALAGDRKGADRWFAEATKRADKLPFGYYRWGWSLLVLGDADGAIAKLKLAHNRGPRSADPLELWGEALMKRGDFAGAVGKFKEADKHAPRWGRNHMLWGEALMLAGRYAEARAQYQTANDLDLSKPDRAALDVLLARTSSGPLHG
jgi:tetratricopeptide (TPR) repeat protein